jgi:transposase InsO family protein|tara:strand:- start:1423 stop:2832 length:1410 start_codon:yes stop_codon:yes gene_type:complete
MDHEAQAQKRREITEFRYALVAELANPYLSAAQVSELIRFKASQEHEIPYLGKRRLSEACIRKWMYAYRKHGKAGLEPKVRSDAGRCRSLSESETAVLMNALEAKSHLTATTVLAQLRKKGAIKGTISSSSLSRLVCSMGLKREQRVRTAEEEKHLKFEFFSPLECVQADCMYTISVPDVKGRKRKAILLTFIDDATRRILYTHFAFSERALDFEAGIKHILAAHGLIGRLYVDNAANFISMQTKRITDSLGVLLIHSRPYTPRGRGKQERFYRTAREQLFRPLDPDSVAGLADLSVRFRSWVETEYHRNPHRGLSGATPLDRWLERAPHIVPVDPTIDLDSAFMHEVTRKVYRDSTFTIDGLLYEVSSSLIGERVTVRYDPRVPPERRRLSVLLGQIDCGTARIVDSYANTKVRRSDLNKDISAEIQPDEDQPTPDRSPSVIDASLAATGLTSAPSEPEDEEEQDDAS